MRKTMNFINVAQVFPDDMEITVREICRRARTVGLNKIALCLSFHPQGTPAKENADFLLQLHRNVRAALKAECDGLQIGVLVQSRGIRLVSDCTGQDDSAPDPERVDDPDAGFSERVSHGNVGRNGFSGVGPAWRPAGWR